MQFILLWILSSDIARWNRRAAGQIEHRQSKRIYRGREASCPSRLSTKTDESLCMSLPTDRRLSSRPVAVSQITTDWPSSVRDTVAIR